MKIFLDFDNVLMNTWEFFHEDIFAVYNQKFRVTREDFERTFRMFSTASGISGECFTPEKQLKELGADGDKRKEILDAVQALLDTRTYEFPDVREFLSKFRKEDLIVLTYGAPEFQWQKIRNTNVAQMVGEIIVTDGDKIDELAKRTNPGEQFAFVDDSAGYFESLSIREELHLRCASFHLFRPEYGMPECAGCLAAHDVKSLGDVADTLCSA